MDRELGRRVKERFSEENGYLLVSTLFFLIFSGLFSHSVMQLASNNLIQLNQLSNAYQAKAVLEMSANLLNNEIEKNHYPEQGQIDTSIGSVEMSRKEVGEEYHYKFLLSDKNDMTYIKDVYVEIVENEEETEQTEEVIEEEITEAEKTDEEIEKE